jgi:hypothetical protein
VLRDARRIGEYYPAGLLPINSCAVPDDSCARYTAREKTAWIRKLAAILVVDVVGYSRLAGRARGAYLRVFEASAAISSTPPSPRRFVSESSICHAGVLARKIQ